MGSMPSLVDVVKKAPSQPPTHFDTNKFTVAYQFVNVYGTPRYREINPAVFTAITFPFLFGVMYGDVGHGFCLALAGLYLVLTENRMKQGNMNEMLGMLYGGRYMIFMMGIFATYAGLVYNDFFALPLNIFGSKFTYPECAEGEECTAVFLHGNATSGDAGDRIYAFGLDPIWKSSTNELVFFNSFKMKLSVILGMAQMMTGIFLKGWNCLYFGEYLDFFFEFIPMVFFASSLFVYMIYDYDEVVN